MRFVVVLCAAALMGLSSAPARAEVAGASPSAFEIRAEAETTATPQQAWRAVTRLDRWWNAQHTYSGNAGRLRLEARAGGCWCERWGNGQSVEHARVVLVMEHDGVRTLRAVGGLGPLQEMGVNGALTFTVAPHASGAKITMTYRVTGDASSGLDQVAPLVDMVLTEQFGRLIRYSGSGSPN
jgi:uncharacterized protein YndB with AHSA1/START domain